jgi:cell division protein FtsW (lipid II flippase)
MQRFNFPPWLCLCLPILVGVTVMVFGGAPLARWGTHLAAAVLGLAVYAAVTSVRRRVPGMGVGVALLAFAAVASTLLSTGIDGVQRWHEVGPLRVHPSALFAPLVLMVGAGRVLRRRVAVHASLLGLQAVHFLQPDAGQATALACGAIAFVLADGQQRQRALLVLTYLISAAATWARFDPLPPAAFVEDIVARSFSLAPALGVVALVSLLLLVASPLLAEQTRRSRPAAIALSAYLAAAILVVCVGEYPVPLLGFGTSPTLGAFLALAVLRLVADNTTRASEEVHRSSADVSQPSVPEKPWEQCAA